MYILTDAEWQIMDILWSGDGLTQPEIRARLEEKGVRWAGNTVHTFLTRLEKKGAVEIDKSASPHCYRPLVTRAACEEEALAHLRRQAFGGSAGRMISHLLGEDSMTREEIEALRRYLDTHM